MSNHISDELPRLLTGDAGRDVVMAAAEHLRTCPDCQQDLVSAVVAHAALTSAHRFAPEIVAGDASAGEESTDAEADAVVTPLPDMSAVFAQARDDASKPVVPARRRRRLVAVVAAAAVIVGSGATVAALELGSSTSAARSVALEPYLQGTADDAHAKVTIDGGKLRIDASKLPRLDSQHVYELWLTDATRRNMQSVGTFGTGTAELHVDPKVMSKYNHFEVSIQRPNQIKYSRVSVVRGDYG